MRNIYNLIWESEEKNIENVSFTDMSNIIMKKKLIICDVTPQNQADCRNFILDFSPIQKIIFCYDPFDTNRSFTAK